MDIISETGTIVRAIQQGASFEVKMRRPDGSALILDIANERHDLVRFARDARMDGVSVLVRYTADGRIVGFAQAQAAVAA